MPATYNLKNPSGQVRFRIPDTNISNPIFDDTEIKYLLDTNKQNAFLAAAEALDIIAGDPGRLVQFSHGSKSGVRTTAEDIRKRAAMLRRQAHGGGIQGGIQVSVIERTDFPCDQ